MSKTTQHIEKLMKNLSDNFDSFLKDEINSTYTTASEIPTLTLDVINKAKALLDNIKDPWKALFEENGFSVEGGDGLILPEDIWNDLASKIFMPGYVVKSKFINDGHFMKGYCNYNYLK